jgi:hypothetical protein
MNVTDSNMLECVSCEKPVLTFSHRALRTAHLCAVAVTLDRTALHKSGNGIAEVLFYFSYRINRLLRKSRETQAH